jgi:predicted DNA-binding transcriptional regulator AlpA
VGRIYPEPIRLWGVGIRWRKTDLDEWIAGLGEEGIIDAADLL